jgi:hypothetical protein
MDPAEEIALCRKSLKSINFQIKALEARKELLISRIKELGGDTN